ncbi:MAG: cysteine desulfurase [Azoarcus sp.]|jgi:cysteine desulfurase|nr:cysteine desulfurase [Azoarcus sp.]
MIAPFAPPPVYLDWNATAPLDPAVSEAMLPWLGEHFGNASSLHALGRRARMAVETAREQVAAAVGAQPGEVIFTSGGSEANNLFIKGMAANRAPGILAVSAIEHPCVLEPARQLIRQGWRLREIAVTASGVVDPAGDAWREALALRPALVSVMTANNEMGAVQDIAALAAAARAAGACFHSDAVQALGRLMLDFRASGMAAMTLSAHKIGGPAGAGALLLDKRVDLAPLVTGGGQERGLRSGTENVAALVGFGVAAERAAARQTKEATRLAALRGECEARLVAAGATVFAREAPRLPNTVYFAFEGIDGDTLAGWLDHAGFACGSGSACSSAHPGTSHVLRAMGVAPALARCALRVSMGRDTSAADIESFCTALARAVAALKGLAAVSGMASPT